MFKKKESVSVYDKAGLKNKNLKFSKRLALIKKQSITKIEIGTTAQSRRTKKNSIMDKNEVIDKVKAYKKLLMNYFEMDKVYLFGSYAKNTSREDSDIDVAIVVDQLEGDYFAINPVLWKLRRQIDDRIEPVLIEKKFDDGNFLDEIQRNGIEIT